MPIEHMSPLVAVLLGLLQGLTEFLPVSSTAHMDIVPQLFHMPDPGAAFSAIAQLGPIIAIIWYFRHDLLRYIKGMIRTKNPMKVAPGDEDARLGWYTFFGTIPILIFGALLQHKIEHEFRALQVVAVSMIVLGLILAFAELLGRRKTSLSKMNFKESQAIGWAQILSLIPGTSRSGVTITAGLLLGLEREAAARFSFLLSVPAITAAGVFQLLKTIKQPIMHENLKVYLLGALVAGIFAYVVVTWFLGFMKEHNTGIFIAYRILFGIVVLLLLHTGALHNMPPQDGAAQGAHLASAKFTVPHRDFEITPDGHYTPADTSNP